MPLTKAEQYEVRRRKQRAADSLREEENHERFYATKDHAKAKRKRNRKRSAKRGPKRKLMVPGAKRTHLSCRDFDKKHRKLQKENLKRQAEYKAVVGVLGVMQADPSGDVMWRNLARRKLLKLIEKELDEVVTGGPTAFLEKMETVLSRFEHEVESYNTH